MKHRLSHCTSGRALSLLREGQADLALGLQLKRERGLAQHTLGQARLVALAPPEVLTPHKALAPREGLARAMRDPLDWSQLAEQGEILVPREAPLIAHARKTCAGLLPAWPRLIEVDSPATAAALARAQGSVALMSEQSARLFCSDGLALHRLGAPEVRLPICLFSSTDSIKSMAKPFLGLLSEAYATARAS